MGCKIRDVYSIFLSFLLSSHDKLFVVDLHSDNDYSSFIACTLDNMKHSSVVLKTGFHESWSNITRTL